MINFLRLKLKKNFFLYNLIVQTKFAFNLGLEEEAKFIKNKYKFNVAVDIGSNAGYFTKMLSKISKKVYSFEPIDYLVKSQKHLFKGANITIFKLALSSEKLVKKFYIPVGNDPEASFIKKKNSTVIKVLVNKGDNIIKNKNIDFIKIDVEGSELETLYGLKKIIKKNYPLFLIEIEKRHNKNYLKVFKFLTKKKYQIYYLDKKKMNLKKLKISKLNYFFNKKQNISKLGTDNYINNFFFKHS